MTSFSGVRFSHWKLAHGPSQEVKSHDALVWPERMGNSRFTWFQFQPNVLEPCF